MTKLLQSCRIAPPPHTVAEQSLPLTFLDLIWLSFPPIRRLLFYELPDSSIPYFLETLVPKLKESLSLTLKHFFPLAGTVVFPLNPDKKPEIRYRPGDSVPVTFFESSDDFDYLVGNQARDADKFYDFIPLLSQINDEESDQTLQEVIAIQVTLFPGRGVCIGLSTTHCIGDAISMAGFMKTWALINKLGGEEGLLIESLPVFDRSLINYPRELDSVFQNQIRDIPMGEPSFPLPTNRVRATYVLTEHEIKKLKDFVQTRIPHVSSFVVITAYVWVCFAKALITGEEYEEKVVVDEDEPEFFLFGVDARDRIDPPVPGNYFGNCLSFALPKLQHGELVGEEGLFMAAVAIIEEFKSREINDGNIFGGAEGWLAEAAFAMQNPILMLSGSSRLDLYSVDFGWGRARKVEALSIDGDRYAMSLCKSRDCEGGLEVGLSLPKVVMDAFDVLFYDGIRGNKCAVVVSRL